jgi:hypothetical protein
MPSQLSVKHMKAILLAPLCLLVSLSNLKCQKDDPIEPEVYLGSCVRIDRCIDYFGNIKYNYKSTGKCEAERGQFVDTQCPVVDTIGSCTSFADSVKGITRYALSYGSRQFAETVCALSVGQWSVNYSYSETYGKIKITVNDTSPGNPLHALLVKDQKVIAATALDSKTLATNTEFTAKEANSQGCASGYDAVLANGSYTLYIQTYRKKDGNEILVRCDGKGAAIMNSDYISKRTINVSGNTTATFMSGDFVAAQPQTLSITTNDAVNFQKYVSCQIHLAEAVQGSNFNGLLAAQSWQITNASGNTTLNGLTLLGGSLYSGICHIDRNGNSVVDSGDLRALLLNFTATGTVNMSGFALIP